MKLIMKLQLLLFLSTILIFSLFSYVAYNYDEMRFLDQTKQKLTAIANIQKNRLHQFLEVQEQKVKIITSKTQMRLSLDQYLKTKDEKHLQLLVRILEDTRMNLKNNISLSITDLYGNILVSTDKKAATLHMKIFPKAKELLQEITFDTHTSPTGSLHFGTRAPVYLDGKILGTIVVDSEISSLAEISQDYTGLGETGETVIAKSTANGALFLTPLRFDKEASYKRTISATKQNAPIIKALNNEIGFFSSTVDYRGVPVYSATQYLENVYWAVIVKVDKEEVEGKLNQYRNELMGVLMFIFPLILFLSYLIARSFVHPIMELISVVQSFEKGNYTQKAKQSLENEVGVLGKTFNTMAQEVRQTQKRLEEAQHLTNMGSWEIDIESGAIIWSKNVYNIFEIPHDQRDQEITYENFFNFVYSDDKKNLKESFEHAVQHNEKYYIEHRIVTPEGKIKFVEQIAIHQTNEIGKVIKSYGAVIDVTEKKEKNFQLQEQLRLTDEYIIMSTTDIHGNITYASKAFCEISGYSAKELMGQNHRIVRHPDMTKELYKDLWRTLLSKKTWSGEIKNRRKDGSYYWVYATISPVFDFNNNIIGYTAIRDDIADKKNFQEAQRIAKMGSWELDLETDEIHCSEELCNLVEVPVTTHYPKNYLMSFIKSKYQERVLYKLEQSVVTNEKFEDEFEIETSNGITKTIFALGEIEIDQNNKAIKIIGILLDITERKKIEQELHAAKIQAEQASVTKSDFVANMSHEIRTPMNAILGFTDLAIKEGKFEDNVYQYLKKSKSAAIGLLEIINDILDFSKIESNKLIIEELSFDLKNLMVEVIEIMEFQANKKKVDLQLEFIEVADCYIGDRLRLKQILINIIGNAVKFTKKGYVKIEVAKVAGTIQFKVSDTGIGMSSEQLEKIFEPFVQADTSTARNFGGTGLGTVISKELVELMHGEIKVQSKQNIGSVFSIEIPLEETQCLESFYEEEAVENKNYISERLFDILVVEDNKLNVELIEINLGNNIGHTITWVENGQEALDEVKKHYSKYDLILMDVQMPVMDGIEATQKIREYEKQLKTHKPILALTASVTVEEQEVTKVAGMDGFALKPIVISDLLSEMQRIVPEGIGKENKNLEIQAIKKETVQNSLEHLKPMINIDHGLKTWIKKEAYTKALKSFSTNHKNDITLIKEALETENFEVALRLLHTLKGLSFGFVNLQKSAQIVHNQLLNKESNMSLTQLSEDFATTVALIDTLKSEEKIDTKNLLSGEELKNKTKKLIEMLDNGESDDNLAKDVFESLKAQYDEEKSEEFYTHIENFDYELANEILHTIYEEIK